MFKDIIFFPNIGYWKAFQDNKHHTAFSCTLIHSLTLLLFKIIFKFYFEFFTFRDILVNTAVTLLYLNMYHENKNIKLFTP